LPLHEGPLDLLGHFATRLVDVAQFVGFVNHDQVPGDGPQQGAVAAGEVDGGDHHQGLVKGIGLALALNLAHGAGVDDAVGEMKFFLEFHAPLHPQSGRADDQQPAAALGPVLAKDQPRLDGLAQPDLVSEDHAPGKRGAEGEEGGLELMGIEIDVGVEEGVGDFADEIAAEVLRQGVGVKFGMKCCGH